MRTRLVTPQPPQVRLQPPHGVHSPHEPVGYGVLGWFVVAWAVVVSSVVVTTVVVGATVVKDVVETGMGGGASPSEKKIVKICNI